MENPPFLMGKSTISMAIFNSYVKLPEGTTIIVAILGAVPVISGGKKNIVLGILSQLLV